LVELMVNYCIKTRTSDEKNKRRIEAAEMRAIVPVCVYDYTKSNLNM